MRGILTIIFLKLNSTKIWTFSQLYSRMSFIQPDLPNDHLPSQVREARASFAASPNKESNNKSTDFLPKAYSWGQSILM